MAKDVTPLKFHTPEPDEKLVEALEELLAWAREGKLRGLLYVGDFSSNECIKGFFGRFGSYFTAIGAAEHLKFMAHRALIGRDAFKS